MKVFIADDSEVLRERLTNMLNDIEGIEIVGEAGNGAEAVGSILKLQPDVVILDIRMPEGNGINALQAIKKAQPDIVVIMFTNYPYPQYRRKCIVAGADYFFDKSTEFEKVTETLKQSLQDSKKDF